MGCRLCSSISPPLSLPVSPRLMGGPEPTTSPRSWSTPRDCEQPRFYGAEPETRSFPLLSFSFPHPHTCTHIHPHTSHPPPCRRFIQPGCRGSDSQLRRCPAPLNKCNGLVLALPPHLAISLTHFPITLCTKESKNQLRNALMASESVQEPLWKSLISSNNLSLLNKWPSLCLHKV